MAAVDVAIGIVLLNGRIIIGRRREQVHLGGYWEFPGGKCEADESPVDCLRREIAEELGIVVRPIRTFAPIEFSYESRAVRLHPFLCEHVSGEPTARAASEVRWVTPGELSQYRFPPANTDLIAELQALLQESAHQIDRSV